MEQPQYCPSTGCTTEISPTLLRILVASRCSLYPLEEFHPIKLIEILKQVNAHAEYNRKEKVKLAVSLKVVEFLVIPIMNFLNVITVLGKFIMNYRPSLTLDICICSTKFSSWCFDVSLSTKHLFIHLFTYSFIFSFTQQINWTLYWSLGVRWWT